MNVKERNKVIAECITEFQKVHDDFFPRGKPLSDDEWQYCIAAMADVAEKYRKDIPTISGKLCMAFLDDIEEYHKKWTEYLNEKS